MAKIYYEKTTPYSVEQLFHLVNDVNAYPDFVPHCSRAGILSQTDTQLSAFIEIDKLGFKKRFSTQNTLFFPQRIEIKLLDGPFKRLTGEWRFTALSNAQSQIALQLDFEFNNRLLEMAFSSVFQEVMRNMVNAFTQRATTIYGGSAL